MNHPAGQFRPLCSPGFICLVLGLATLAVYFPVCSFGFVDFDDSGYFFANPHILTGLTWSNIQWAFTSGEDANWHPLTWISLMLDETFFGAGAGGPHVVNVLLHAANSILLFLLFLQMTGAIWRCAGMAMFFAIHPLHVESVAWISERKDVLSAFFGLLALMCYVRCVHLVRKRPGGASNAPSTSGENDHKSFRRGCPVLFYILSLFFFACGLMSKPMLVTLPCVMLLLDFWPLQRLGDRVSVSAIGRIVIEKIPFFLLTAATSAVTYVIQRNGMAVVPLSVIPMGARIENAFVSYARYIGKTFCPTGLAAIYPYPGYWPGFMVFLSVVLFVGLGIVALAGLRRFPWFLTGWCWFVGMLVPVIGLVQVGEQAMADRYAYLPMVGVLVIVIWGAGAFCLAWRPPRPLLLGVSVLLFTVCAWRARDQVLTWKDDGSLFGHALAVTKDNYMAELNMGF
ncbi:MAG TPA: hypothetical protein VGY98_02190, partial [Verrucomicrobiae bacterium]|nr:hypothetical protein [Verrucomicrobiae bacterium]